MTSIDGLDFRVLGPVRVLRAGASVALGGTKRRALLALLVSSPNRAISTASIAEALWEEDPPPSVNTSIQVAVSAVRAALGSTSSVPSPIQTVPPGYRLSLSAEGSDLARFRLRRGEAVGARRRGDEAEAARLLRAGLAEWTGMAYEDLLDLRFAADLGARLEEERLATLEDRVEVDLALGQHRELVSELAGLTADHPLRESMWGKYILALYRSGRQADALAAYRGLRQTLDDELGLEPNAALRRLEAAVLAQDPALDLGEAQGGTAPKGSRAQVMATERDLSLLEPVVLVMPDGREIPVPPSGLSVGRDVDNDVVVVHPRVSRHHAAIVAGPVCHLLVDLDSTNGSWVNEQRVVGKRPVAPGDEIRLGEPVFRLRRP